MLKRYFCQTEMLTHVEGFEQCFNTLKNNKLYNEKLNKSSINDYFRELDNFKNFRLGVSLNEEIYKNFQINNIRILKNNPNISLYYKFWDFQNKFMADDINIYNIILPLYLKQTIFRPSPEIFKLDFLIKNKFEYNNTYNNNYLEFQKICNDVILMDKNYFHDLNNSVNENNSFKLALNTIYLNNDNLDNVTMFSKLIEKHYKNLHELSNKYGTSYLFKIIEIIYNNKSFHMQSYYLIIEKIIYIIIENITKEIDKTQNKIDSFNEYNSVILGHDNISWNQLLLIFKIYYNDVFYDSNILKNLLNVLNFKFSYDVIDFETCYEFLVLINDNRLNLPDECFYIFEKNLQLQITSKFKIKDYEEEYFWNELNIDKWSEIIISENDLGLEFINYIKSKLLNFYQDLLDKEDLKYKDEYIELLKIN